MTENADFIRQAEQIRDGLIAKANKAIRAANEWFATTKQMLQTTGGPVEADEMPLPPEKRIASPAKQGERPDLPGRIREFIATTGGKQFTTNDVRAFLAASGIDMTTVSRRTTLSTLLKRMSYKKIIDRLKKGAGATPSVYRARVEETKPTA